MNYFIKFQKYISLIWEIMKRFIKLKLMVIYVKITFTKLTKYVSLLILDNMN